jgi:hypothetical protein
MSYTKILWTVVAAISTIYPVCAQNCEILRDAHAKRMIDYLTETSRSEGEAPCIGFAIRRLGDAHARAAIPILIDYLDYKRPLDEGEKNGFYLHAPIVPEMYPAASALFAIGKPSVPYLLEVVEAADTHEQKQSNAVCAVMLIYREHMPDGIKLLKETSRSRANSGDEQKAQRLRDAAKDAVRYCTLTKEDCEKALEDSNPR